MNNKTTLFIITSRFPFPIEKGDKLRIYYQIKYLSKEYNIILCSLNENNVEINHIKELEKYCKEVHIFHLKKWQIFSQLIIKSPSKTPSQVSYFFNKKIKEKIQLLIKNKKPDYIYCHLIRCAEYVKDINIPKTIDYMDSFSLGMNRRSKTSIFPLSYIFKREAGLLADYEKNIYSYFNNHTIISENDKSLMKLNDKEIDVIPNGVDIDFFQPKKRTVEYDLVFVGNMGYAPNIEAAKYIGKKLLPLLLKYKPDIKILIAGARPHIDVRSLADRNITISGWVDDIRDAYASGDIFIAPLFIGSGQQNKILEAMAMQKSCITTSLVNKAILAKNEESILIADNEYEFLEQFKKLHENHSLKDQIAKEGFNFVKLNYSWQKSVERLSHIIKE